MTGIIPCHLPPLPATSTNPLTLCMCHMPAFAAHSLFPLPACSFHLTYMLHALHAYTHMPACLPVYATHLLLATFAGLALPCSCPSHVTCYFCMHFYTCLHITHLWLLFYTYLYLFKWGQICETCVYWPKGDISGMGGRRRT